MRKCLIYRFTKNGFIFQDFKNIQIFLSRIKYFYHYMIIIVINSIIYDHHKKLETK